MINIPAGSTVGVLASGGLDSAVLLARLLESGVVVQPFYVDCGLVWQEAERRALQRYLHAVAAPELLSLVVLDLPLADLYADHWSITGRNVPGADTPDEAVYLPGHNALLIIKAALWCQLRDIDALALATLASNPFSDASDDFFRNLEATLNRAPERGLRLLRPFADMTKSQVMDLGRAYPLELTFCCLAPVGELHCGHCNKCAERQAAFRWLETEDPTPYAAAR